VENSFIIIYEQKITIRLIGFNTRFVLQEILVKN